jgi:hypothetical protein
LSSGQGTSGTSIMGPARCSCSTATPVSREREHERDTVDGQVTPGQPGEVCGQGVGLRTRGVVREQCLEGREDRTVLRVAELGRRLTFQNMLTALPGSRRSTSGRDPSKPLFSTTMIQSPTWRTRAIGMSDPASASPPSPAWLRSPPNAAATPARSAGVTSVMQPASPTAESRTQSNLLTSSIDTLSLHPCRSHPTAR